MRFFGTPHSIRLMQLVSTLVCLRVISLIPTNCGRHMWMVPNCYNYHVTVSLPVPLFCTRFDYRGGKNRNDGSAKDIVGFDGKIINEILWTNEFCERISKARSLLTGGRPLEGSKNIFSIDFASNIRPTDYLCVNLYEITPNRIVSYPMTAPLVPEKSMSDTDLIGKQQDKD